MNRGDAFRIFYNLLAAEICPRFGEYCVQLVIAGSPIFPEEDIEYLASSLALQFSQGVGIPKFVSVAENADLLQSLEAPIVYDLRRAKERIVIGENHRRRPNIVFIRSEAQPDLDCEKVIFDRNKVSLYQAVTSAFAEIVKLSRYKEQALEMPIRYLVAGLRSVFDDFAIFEIEKSGPTAKNVEKLISILATECRYAGKHIEEQAVHDWLGQFDELSRPGAVALLSYIRASGYHSTREIVRLLIDLLNSKVPDAQLVSIQPAGKSEGMLLYEMRKFNDTQALDVAISGSSIHLACIDDVVGSGDTMLQRLFEPGGRDKKMSEWLSRGQNHISVIAAIAHRDGISNIQCDPRSQGKIKVHAHKIMDDEHGVFSSKYNPFAPQNVLDNFRQACERIGNLIYPMNPFGWGDCAWGIVTEYNVPDCSLPVIWSNDVGVPWTALFPRR